jgi:hypothetical protein
MALNMSIIDSREGAGTVTETTPVPDEVAKELAEAYAALKELPNSRQVSVDFATAKEARLFVRQGQAWAKAQTPVLSFSRRGDVKALPTRVQFRIYVPRPKDTEE